MKKILLLLLFSGSFALGMHRGVGGEPRLIISSEKVFVPGQGDAYPGFWRDRKGRIFQLFLFMYRDELPPTISIVGIKQSYSRLELKASLFSVFVSACVDGGVGQCPGIRRYFSKCRSYSLALGTVDVSGAREIRSIFSRHARLGRGAASRS